MTKTFEPGDRVSWLSSGGKSIGRVIRKLTARMRIKGHTVAASKDDPQFLVRSDKSGAEAAHKPEALHRT